ncbi:hypothetical protein Hanom_Chr17g01550341 [Helianthus anomalus]
MLPVQSLVVGNDLKYKAIRRFDIFRNQICGYSKNSHIISHMSCKQHDKKKRI